MLPLRCESSRWRRLISERYEQKVTHNFSVLQAAGRPAIPHQMWEAAAAWLDSSGVLGWRYQTDRYANANRNTDIISSEWSTLLIFCFLFIWKWNGTKTTQTSGLTPARIEDQSDTSLKTHSRPRRLSVPPDGTVVSTAPWKPSVNVEQWMFYLETNALYLTGRMIW